jgi:pimeloyl-ACP methyl ester carboxylesterase
VSVRTGRIKAGEVELFYRAVGEPGGRPILILHGANYYDSADWVQVAGALAGDREVVTYDARGFGESSWSQSKDYSVSAQLEDIAAVSDHFGWDAPVLLAHSRGALFALLYADSFPKRVGALILADWWPGRATAGAARARGPAVDPEPEVFATLEDALADTSRDPASLERPAARERFQQLWKSVPGGYQLARRDPHFRSGAAAPGADELWAALARLELPMLAIRATASAAFDDARVARIRSELPRVELVEFDSGHDLAQTVPGELTSAVQQFVRYL